MNLGIKNLPLQIIVSRENERKTLTMEEHENESNGNCAQNR